MSRRDAFSSHIYRRNASLGSAAFITKSSEDLSLDVRRSLKIDGRRYERKKKLRRKCSLTNWYKWGWEGSHFLRFRVFPRASICGNAYLLYIYSTDDCERTSR